MTAEITKPEDANYRNKLVTYNADIIAKILQVLNFPFEKGDAVWISIIPVQDKIDENALAAKEEV
jgi:hypothetical protein